MIKKGNEIFGNNIKILREIHNESLKDLADAIGVEYQSIQKYENGISIPSKKNMENILRHYNYLALSEDDLMNKDLSYLKEQNKKDIGKSLEYICPTICTEECLKNDSFKSAYSLQKSVYETEVYDASIFEKIQMNYNKCIESNCLIHESYTNLLSFFVYYEITYKLGLLMKDKKIHGEYKNYIDKDEITRVKELFLLNCEECIEYEKDNTLKENGDGLKHFINIHNHTLELMNILKVLGNQELIYYYIAVLYIYDCIPNDLDTKTNKKIGRDMMERFYEVGNEYAKKFINYYNN